MEHEDNSLGRRQHVEHHEQRGSDELGKDRLLFRVEVVADAGDLVGTLVICPFFAP